ncbi:hypothetical protein, partial [Burkholderia cenocepacia]
LHDLACHLKLGTGRIRFAQNKKVVDEVDITKPFVPMFSAWNGYYPNGRLRFTYRQSISRKMFGGIINHHTASRSDISLPELKASHAHLIEFLKNDIKREIAVPELAQYLHPTDGLNDRYKKITGKRRKLNPFIVEYLLF